VQFFSKFWKKGKRGRKVYEGFLKVPKVISMLGALRQSKVAFSGEIVLPLTSHKIT